MVYDIWNVVKLYEFDFSITIEMESVNTHVYLLSDSLKTEIYEM